MENNYEAIAANAYQKKVYSLRDEVIQDEQGNVVTRQTTSVSHVQREPDYVKLYLDFLSYMARTPPALLDATGQLLYELLKRATYAETGGTGMVLALNSWMKSEIAKACNIKLGTLDNKLSSLVNSGLLVRIGRGTFQLNPYYFGKGAWSDVSEIRATVTFDSEKGRWISSLEHKTKVNGKEVPSSSGNSEAANGADPT